MELILSCLYQTVTGKVEEVVEFSVLDSMLISHVNLPHEFSDLLVELRKGEHRLEVQDMELIRQLLIQTDEKLPGLSF